MKPGAVRHAPWRLHTPGGYSGRMPHSPEDKKKALLRVRRIRGQAEALERALEAGEDCGPVLQQLAAIRGAINGLMAEVFESHLREQLGVLSGHEPQAAAPVDPRHHQLVQDMTTLVRSYLK